MKDIKPSQPNQPFFIINLALCVTGTFVILWFAFGVEQQNSQAQILFEWMLKYSTFIIVSLAAFMALILAGSYFGMKRIKGTQKP